MLDLRDGPRDECGVFGVAAPGHDVARLAYFALYALQHRGQESAGIASSSNGRILTVRLTDLAVRRHTVLRKPWCPACLSPDQADPPEGGDAGAG